MFKSYTLCTPLKSKSASEVVQTYDGNICSNFDVATHFLSDNGTEFINSLCKYVAKQLEV